MNRRNFLTGLAKSFLILPGAGRVWKAVAKEPAGYMTYTDLVNVRESLKSFVIPYGYFRFIPSFQDFLATLDPHQRGHLEAKLVVRNRPAFHVINNPPIIRPL